MYRDGSSSYYNSFNVNRVFNITSFPEHKHSAARKTPSLQQISVRLPLLLRDPKHCKQSLKLKANSYNINNGTSVDDRTAKVAMCPLQYYCPSGQPCDKMKNQHDILIHLQKSHQTSVVQYYAAPGDQLSINFNESCVTCIVLVPETAQDENNNSSRHKASSNSNCGIIRNKLTSAVMEQNEHFFLAKFRCIETSSQALYWLWYLGSIESVNRFHVTISDVHSQISWSGVPISLRQNCKEALKTKQFVRLNYETKGLRVKVEFRK